MYRSFFKRLIDVLVSAVALVVVCPILIITAVMLVVGNRGNPFFFQQRPGKRNKIFKVIKFKTMNDRRDEHGHLLPDIQRLTPLGKFIRSTSIDELPQLINVLKGNMSLIGPRPLLVKYLPLYNKVQVRRHEVRPGITGWAQVNGRNAISWEERFNLDVWYVDNISLVLDMRILWLTVKKVLRRESINAVNSATMEAFKGNHID